MAQAQTAAPVGVPSLRLVGRIENVKRISTARGPMFANLVKLRAADEFSSPATVRVMSAERCGEPGQTFDQVVQVGGYGRSYQTTDEETGRKVNVPTADNTLTVIG